MRKASKVTLVRVMLFLISILVLMSANVTVDWLIDGARVSGLVTLATAMVAALLVVHFDWRAKLLNRARVERHEYGEAT